MKLKKFAAIDIGSNAMRLLIKNVIIQEDKAPIFTKNTMLRVPVRLGDDVFTAGFISEKKSKKLILALKAVQLLMKVHQVDHYLAYATSAFRDATNKEMVQANLLKKTGIDIHILSGREEAEIIAQNKVADAMINSHCYLYIDVGGGSTELSIFCNGVIKKSKSFDLGKVRLLNKTIPKSLWDEFEQWIEKNTKELGSITAIGSGGTINKIFKLSGYKRDEHLSYKYIDALYSEMKKKSVEAIMIDYKLNADQADTIVPATKIYLLAMKYARIKEMIVPKIGLVDGIVEKAYQNYMKER